MTGRPIVTPRFASVRPDDARLVVKGLDGDDYRNVRVVVCVGQAEVADLSNVLHGVGVTVDPNGLATIDFEGYVAEGTVLPENARRVYVAADGTFDVDLHDCPHLYAFGDAACRWCGEPIEEPEITTAGDPLPDLPNIGDTCCGKCPGGTCYVDQITGA